jgi:hypothetical protein
MVIILDAAVLVLPIEGIHKATVEMISCGIKYIQSFVSIG